MHQYFIYTHTYIYNIKHIQKQKKNENKTIPNQRYTINYHMS